MKIKAVLFDKDGTLLDFSETFSAACQAVIRKLACGNNELEKNLADIVDFDMNTLEFPMRSILVAGTSIDAAKIWQPILGHKNVDELARKLDQMLDEETLKSITSFSFTLPTLQTLFALNIPMGVATNDAENNARNHLNAISAEKYFDFIAGYDSGFGQKPQPGMVEAFANFQNIAVGETAMVGDSIADMKAAKSAGALAIAVASGPTDKIYLAKHCDILLDDISGLPDCLNSL